MRSSQELLRSKKRELLIYKNGSAERKLCGSFLFFRKVFVHLFQKVAGSRVGALVAPRKERNSLYSLSFCGATCCAAFLLWAYCVQRKSGRTIIGNFISQTAAPLSANILFAFFFTGLCPAPAKKLFEKSFLDLQKLY